MFPSPAATKLLTNYQSDVDLIWYGGFLMQGRGGLFLKRPTQVPAVTAKLYRNQRAYVIPSRAGNRG